MQRSNGRHYFPTISSPGSKPTSPRPSASLPCTCFWDTAAVRPWPIANRAQDSKSPTSLRWVSAWTHIPLPVCMEPTMYVFLTRQLLARHLVRLQYSNAHHNRCLPKRAWAMTAPFRPDSTGDGAKRRLPNHRSKSHRLAQVKTWRSSSTSTLVPTLAPR